MGRAAFPLIRYSHIFSSAVREVLEVALLREAGVDGLTPRQLHLLEFIGLAAHHIDEVAKFLGVTPPAATKAVDTLERHGLVVRKAHDTDRRVTMLGCSDAGRQLVERYRKLEEEKLDRVLQGFSDEDTDRLTDLLERYALALINSAPNSNAICLRCSGHYDSGCPLQFNEPGCAFTAETNDGH
ncbi:MAG TPA: MarR family transcriptional regulator [Thermoanaerobaculia bacterium]|nr:MarR family transcriptional regulator [Thermoanaerobaculia bacterium]